MRPTWVPGIAGEGEEESLFRLLPTPTPTPTAAANGKRKPGGVALPLPASKSSMSSIFSPFSSLSSALNKNNPSRLPNPFSYIFKSKLPILLLISFNWCNHPNFYLKLEIKTLSFLQFFNHIPNLKIYTVNSYFIILSRCYKPNLRIFKFKIFNLLQNIYKASKNL